MKFKLKHGSHSEKNKTYKPGDIIISNARLDIAFKGKFEFLRDEKPIEMELNGLYCTYFDQKEINPKVSIVMPTYNQGKYIKEAIDSILSQEYKNFELIIVNDGCTDNTKEIIETYNDDRIIYIEQKNQGTGAALNAGFKIATGSMQTWFSSDSVVYDNYLSVLVEALQNNPNIGFVYSDCDVINFNKTRPLLRNKPFNRTLLYTENYIGISWLFRKHIKDKAGLYMTRMGEDYDMYLRMSELTDFLYIPKSLAAWRDHAENLSQTKARPSGNKDHYITIAENKERRNHPFFTIMMPTKNRPVFLKTALACLKNQLFSNFEVLIWSNSDNKKEDENIVIDFKDERFKYIKESKTLPVYTTRNILTKIAKGKYITSLDDDDLLTPDALAIRQKMIVQTMSPDFVFTDYIIRVGKNDIIQKSEILDMNKIIKNKGIVGCIGAGVSYRKDIFDKYCFDDTTFPDLSGDLDFVLTLIREKLDYAFVNKATYIYNIHPKRSSAGINNDKVKVKEVWDIMKKRHERKSNGTLVQSA